MNNKRIDSNSGTKIYVVAHKKSVFPSNSIYIPIQVGAGGQFLDIRDNCGNNISYKNPTFCELTALYWVWKNDRQSDILGLVHYRRFLTKKWYSNSEEHYLNERDIELALESSDIIVPERFMWQKYTVKEYYSLTAGRDADFLKCRELVFRLAPSYLDAFDKVASSHSAFYCNVLICRRELFDHYCAWLFKILFELEKSIDLEGYSPMESRVFGFISEILLNVWIEKNQLKTAEFPMVKTDVSFIRKIINRFLRGKYYIP